MSIRHGGIWAPQSRAARVDPQHHLGRSCVGFWVPNVTGGSGLVLPDLSGRGNDGTLRNGPTWAAGSRGRGDWALSLSMGSVQYVHIPSSAALDVAGTTVTEATYVRFRLNAGSDVRQYLTSIGDRGFKIFIDSAEKLTYELYNGNSWRTLVADAACNVGQLYDVVATRQANGNMHLWVDDVLKTHGGGTNLNSIGGMDMAIGALPGGGGYFASITIDCVAIFDRAFDAAEVRELYEQPYAMIWEPGRRRFFDLAAPPTASAAYYYAALTANRQGRAA